MNRIWLRRLLVLLSVAVIGSGCASGGSSPPPATATPASATPPVAGSLSENPVIEANLIDVQVAGHTLRIPTGLRVTIFAEDLGSPRFMALDDRGVVYVADPAGGRILRLPDENGDGVADKATEVLRGLDQPHSLAFHGGWLYVAETNEVVRSREDAGVYGAPEIVVPDLPTGGHWSRTIVFGPDGMLYLSIGSSCNVCNEHDDRRASVLRYSADGGDGALFSTGLRNAVGLAFDANGRLWATNNGRDGMGDDVPPETINLLAQGADFGWPGCHAGDIPDPEYTGERGCKGVTQPSVRMQAHSAPLGLAFADATTLGGAFEGSLLVAFHGSWNRTVPTGYKVVLLPFVDGQPTGQTLDFLSGFLLADGSSWARPVGILPLPDGSVLVSDDAGGRIFRISLDRKRPSGS